MLIVSDTTPIISLMKVEQLYLLEKMFGYIASLPPKTQNKELGDKCPPLLSVNFPNLWSTLQLTPSSEPGGFWSTEKEIGE